MWTSGALTVRTPRRYVGLARGEPKICIPQVVRTGASWAPSQ
jgi:hypothetical protein